MNNGQHVFHNPAMSRLDSYVPSDLKGQILRPRRHFCVFTDVVSPSVWGRKHESNLSGKIILTYMSMRGKRVTATWQDNALQ